MHSGEHVRKQFRSHASLKSIHSGTAPPPPQRLGGLSVSLKFQANFAASSFCFPCYGWVYEQNHGYILFINVVTKNTLVYRI